MTALAGPRLYSSNIIGDVNGDGVVTISDINVVVNKVLNGDWDPACDVNNDGTISISDINLLVNIILQGPETVTVDTGMYMGILGYNQTITSKPIALLDSATIGDFTGFVSTLTTQPGRLLYFSVDKALDSFTTAPCPENLQNVAIVTFTEGFDQRSLMMTDK